MVIISRDVKRKRKSDPKPACNLLPDVSKRTKVHAQRKFAQGSNVSSPVITPVQEVELQEKLKPESSTEQDELLSIGRPHTEDFLTFLCFRGTSMLPPTLNVFNSVPVHHKLSSISSRTEKLNNYAPITNLPSKVSTGSNERPFIAFGVRKRADPILVSKHMDKKRRHALALQALRRKYQEQKMAKIRAVTITKLSEKSSVGKNLVSTRSTNKNQNAISKKPFHSKNLKVVSTKHVKVATREPVKLPKGIRTKLKTPIRSQAKQKMCLRSFRGRFIQQELSLRKVKKRRCSLNIIEPKHSGVKVDEKKRMSEFSSGDDEPLAKTTRSANKLFVPKAAKKGSTIMKKSLDMGFRITRTCRPILSSPRDKIIKRKVPVVTHSTPFVKLPSAKNKTLQKKQMYKTKSDEKVNKVKTIDNSRISPKQQKITVESATKKLFTSKATISTSITKNLRCLRTRGKLIKSIKHVKAKGVRDKSPNSIKKRGEVVLEKAKVGDVSPQTDKGLTRSSYKAKTPKIPIKKVSEKINKGLRRNSERCNSLEDVNSSVEETSKKLKEVLLKNQGRSTNQNKDKSLRSSKKYEVVAENIVLNEKTDSNKCDLPKVSENCEVILEKCKVGEFESKYKRDLRSKKGDAIKEKQKESGVKDDSNISLQQKNLKLKSNTNGKTMICTRTNKEFTTSMNSKQSLFNNVIGTRSNIVANRGIFKLKNKLTQLPLKERTLVIMNRSLNMQQKVSIAKRNSQRLGSRLTQDSTVFNKKLFMKVNRKSGSSHITGKEAYQLRDKPNLNSSKDTNKQEFASSEKAVLKEVNIKKEMIRKDNGVYKIKKVFPVESIDEKEFVKTVKCELHEDSELLNNVVKDPMNKPCTEEKCLAEDVLETLNNVVSQKNSEKPEIVAKNNTMVLDNSLPISIKDEKSLIKEEQISDTKKTNMVMSQIRKNSSSYKKLADLKSAEELINSDIYKTKNSKNNLDNTYSLKNSTIVKGPKEVGMLNEKTTKEKLNHEKGDNLHSADFMSAAKPTRQSSRHITHNKLVANKLNNQVSVKKANLSVYKKPVMNINTATKPNNNKSKLSKKNNLPEVKKVKVSEHSRKNAINTTRRDTKNPEISKMSEESNKIILNKTTDVEYGATTILKSSFSNQSSDNNNILKDNGKNQTFIEKLAEKFDKTAKISDEPTSLNNVSPEVIADKQTDLERVIAEEVVLNEPEILNVPMKGCSTNQQIEDIKKCRVERNTEDCLKFLNTDLSLLEEDVKISNLKNPLKYCLLNKESVSSVSSINIADDSANTSNKLEMDKSSAIIVEEKNINTTCNSNIQNSLIEENFSNKVIELISDSANSPNIFEVDNNTPLKENVLCKSEDKCISNLNKYRESDSGFNKNSENNEDVGKGIVDVLVKDKVDTAENGSMAERLANKDIKEESLKSQECSVGLENIITSKIETILSNQSKKSIENIVDKQTYKSRTKKYTKKKSKLNAVLEEPRVQRPSRKTKEAAAIYMEILGHKLVEGDVDDDNVSIDSFPELPNVRKMEQRENELKAKVKTINTISALAFDSSTIVENNNAVVQDNTPNNKECAETLKHNENVVVNENTLASNDISVTSKIEPMNTIGPTKRPVRSAAQAKPFIDFSFSDSDESFYEEKQVIVNKSLKTKSTRNKTYDKSKLNSVRNESEILGNVTFKKVTKLDGSKKINKSGKTLLEHYDKQKQQEVLCVKTSLSDSFSDIDEEPLSKLAQRKSKSIQSDVIENKLLLSKEPKQTFASKGLEVTQSTSVTVNNQTIVVFEVENISNKRSSEQLLPGISGKPKRECTRLPQNYLPLPSSSSDDDESAYIYKNEKSRVIKPVKTADLLCKDLDKRFGKGKVNMSTEQIEKWLKDSALAGDIICKENDDDILKYTECSSNVHLEVSKQENPMENIKKLAPDKSYICTETYDNIDCIKTGNRDCQSIPKNCERKTIFRKERKLSAPNINAFSANNESSVYAFEAENEDSVSTPFRRPSRRPSSTATSKSEDSSKYEEYNKNFGKFRVPSAVKQDLAKIISKHEVPTVSSNGSGVELEDPDTVNEDAHDLIKKSLPIQGAQLKQSLKSFNLNHESSTKLSSRRTPDNSSLMDPPLTTFQRTRGTENKSFLRAKAFDPMSENSEDFKYKIPSSPSASSSSSTARVTKKIPTIKTRIRPIEICMPIVANDFPANQTPALVFEAPTFRPNEKEFQDPLEYIEKIRPRAEQFGICRIIPPSTFKPECKLSDEMRFTAYNQYVHKMMHRWGPNIKEFMAITNYLKTQNITLKHAPWIGGVEIDLPRLYQIVQSLGGLKEVIEKKKWPKVAELMKIPKCAQDRLTKLDDIYCKYLLPYDTLSPDEKEKLFDEVETDWAKRESRALHKSQGNINNCDPTPNSGESDSDNDVDECIVKGRSMALNGFYRIARNTMSMWFKEVEPAANEVEQEFWKHVTQKHHHICVNSGSIDSGNNGYGFAVSKNSPFARHAWNLKVLTNNAGSILRSLGPIMGVTVPTIHVGMVFSACCWYRDPHNLPWIEYLHTGGSKIWYGVPDSMSTAFHSTLTKLVPNYCCDKSIWLPSDTVMVPPSLLVENDVSVSRIVQEPGQFVVVFPKAFTSCICTGYVVSESVYFAPISWISCAHKVFEELQNSCEPAMFSLERLLISISNDPRTSIDVLKQTIPYINSLIESEENSTEQLKALGLTTTEKLPIPEVGIKKKKKFCDDSGSYECELCSRNLFTSWVSDCDDNSIYCLKHAQNYIESKKIKVKNCKIVYTYNKEDLLGLVEKVKLNIEAKLQKKLLGKNAGAAQW